jgi:DNA polymerase-4
VNDAHNNLNVQRKIIHIDMDAFYASVEQRDNPLYRGKPIAVGGMPEGRGGVVATASYEARQFGVRSAMPSKKALQLCPPIIFLRPRFEVYREVSQQIRSIFRRYTDVIEPLSLDEAYLDVTHDKQNIGSAIDIAMLIRKAILDELGLTASAGISINKFVAKIASDINKPNGQTFIGPSRVENFVEALPVEKFYGVGKITAERMKAMNLFTGADLKKLTEEEMVRHFGKTGRFYFNIVRGIDNRTVESNQPTKSLSAEDTFEHDLAELDELNAALESLATIVHRRLAEHNLQGRTITVKIRYHDFKCITRSRSFPTPLLSPEAIAAQSKLLLQSTELEGKRIRLLGITISGFQDHHTTLHTGQLKLFCS